MQTYLLILEELKEVTEKQNQRSWRWLRFWQKSKAQLTQSPTEDPEQERLIDQNQDTEAPKDVHLVLERREARNWSNHNQEEKTPNRLYGQVWNLIRTLERDDG